MTFHISGCKHDTKLILVIDSNIFDVQDIKKVENNPVILTVDLGTQGHTLFSHMVLLISGCMPAIDSILVSNQTYSRSRISEIYFLAPDLDV